MTAFDCALLRFSLERSGKEMSSLEGRAYLEQFKKPGARPRHAVVSIFLSILIFSFLGDMTGPIDYYRNIFTDEDGILYSDNLKVLVPTLLIWGAKDTALNSSAVPISAK